MLARVQDPDGGYSFRVPPHTVYAYTADERENTRILGRLRARRSHAFAVGEAKAHNREISADAYLFLYKELVGLAGERTYCWPGLDYLVERLGRSEGTLKRWMKELEQAELIQRKSRPGGQTSLTYIVAYLQADCGAEAESCSSDHNLDDLDATTLDHSAAPAEEMLPSYSYLEAPAAAPVFFVPAEEITPDPTAGSLLIPHTIKKQESKNRSGGGDVHSASTSVNFGNEDDVGRLLRDEEVLDPQTIIALQSKPLAELRAISGYLNNQANVRCRPGLFAWLAHHDFGARLLAGRQRSREQRRTHREQLVPFGTDDLDKYLVSSQQRDPVPPELSRLWQEALQQLTLTLLPDEYATWIHPIALAALDDDVAFVAAPNIFVRQQVQQTYQARLEEALSRVYGRPIRVEAVIG
ncbi:MAG TPA: DnaA N-terminal domain-containing protein [Herpetosiphonaceae bacterium]|nr:DnaA N-terminal domain-containing protein [Herpetosiphonaceae bacterium]